MTVKHTLVSLDMRVFALCSLMELHRYLRTTSIHQETDDVKKGIKFRFFAFSIYHHQLLPETTELLFYLNIVFWVKLL